MQVPFVIYMHSNSKCVARISIFPKSWHKFSFSGYQVTWTRKGCIDAETQYRRCWSQSCRWTAFFEGTNESFVVLQSIWGKITIRNHRLKIRSSTSPDQLNKPRTIKLSLKAGKVFFCYKPTFRRAPYNEEIIYTFFLFRTLVHAGGNDFEEPEESNHDMIMLAKNSILSLFEDMEAEARYVCPRVLALPIHLPWTFFKLYSRWSQLCEPFKQEGTRYILFRLICFSLNISSKSGGNIWLFAQITGRKIITTKRSLGLCKRN